MGFAEDRGTYIRGRYRDLEGKLRSVLDDNGEEVRFRNKHAAKTAANDVERYIRRGLATARPAAATIIAATGTRPPRPTRPMETFGHYASRWLPLQDLARSTLASYRNCIDFQLLPVFKDTDLDQIDRDTVKRWQLDLKARGYAQSSIDTWRAVLHVILTDAKAEKLIDDNPADKPRNRGRRSVRRGTSRAPEKAITNDLGALLIAERTALLTGRDDDFVAATTLHWTGMRISELRGLETKYIRPGKIRVEWQLQLIDNTFIVEEPKDGSRRDIDLPPWHEELLRLHLTQSSPQPCECHGRTYAFNGSSAIPEIRAPRMADVAELAGVSITTARHALNTPHRVSQHTRLAVEQAFTDLGTKHIPRTKTYRPHWKTTFGTHVVGTAADGYYPQSDPNSKRRPVAVVSQPFPGLPVRGYNPFRIADACWCPIAEGFTPHGARHSHRTQLEELGIAKVLIDDRMGHIDGTISARYAHVTEPMRTRLKDQLTFRWETTLHARRAMNPHSPVAILDNLLSTRGR